MKKFIIRNTQLKDGSTAIWNYTKSLINESVGKGTLLKKMTDREEKLPLTVVLTSIKHYVYEPITKFNNR